MSSLDAPAGGRKLMSDSRIDTRTKIRIHASARLKDPSYNQEALDMHCGGGHQSKGARYLHIQYKYRTPAGRKMSRDSG